MRTAGAFNKIAIDNDAANPALCSSNTLGKESIEASEFPPIVPADPAPILVQAAPPVARLY
jgi:hypothetical protein